MIERTNRRRRQRQRGAAATIAIVALLLYLLLAPPYHEWRGDGGGTAAQGAANLKSASAGAGDDSSSSPTGGPDKLDATVNILERVDVRLRLTVPVTGEETGRLAFQTDPLCWEEPWLTNSAPSAAPCVSGALAPTTDLGEASMLVGTATQGAAPGMADGFFPSAISAGGLSGASASVASNGNGSGTGSSHGANDPPAGSTPPATGGADDRASASGVPASGSGVPASGPGVPASGSGVVFLSGDAFGEPSRDPSKDSSGDPSRSIVVVPSHNNIVSEAGPSQQTDALNGGPRDSEPVEPVAPVPEPGTLVLLAGGLAVAARQLRPKQVRESSDQP